MDQRKKIGPASPPVTSSRLSGDFQAMSDEQLSLIVAGSQINSDNWRNAKAVLQRRADRPASTLAEAELRRREHRNGLVLLAIVVLLVIVLLAFFRS